MHAKLLVLVNVYGWKLKGQLVPFKYSGSSEVRQYVRNFLAEEGFCEQKKFASGPSDWFMIGGRWSGFLALERLDPILWSSCSDILKESHCGLGKIGPSRSERNRGLKIFKEFFPEFKGEILFYRDAYKVIGYEDDAQIVDKFLWSKIVKPLLKKCKDDDFYEDSIIYLDGDIVSLNEKSVLNKMWVVVVDFHR